jgi:hypothetical protein
VPPVLAVITRGPLPPAVSTATLSKEERALAASAGAKAAVAAMRLALPEGTLSLARPQIDDLSDTASILSWRAQEMSEEGVRGPGISPSSPLTLPSSSPTSRTSPWDRNRFARIGALSAEGRERGVKRKHSPSQSCRRTEIPEWTQLELNDCRPAY